MDPTVNKPSVVNNNDQESFIETLPNFEVRDTKKSFLAEKLSLKANTTKLNLVSYLISVMFSITFVVYLNQAQTMVLLDLLEIKNNVGNITGSLAMYDEFMSLLFVFLSGFISDRIGRRLTYVFGFCVVGISFLVYPFSRNVYPDLLIARLLFSIGSSTCTGLISAGLNDVVENKSKNTGIISGVTGTCSSIGALIAVFVLFNLPLTLNKTIIKDFKLSIEVSFIIVAIIAFLVALFVLLFYKKKEYEPTQPLETFHQERNLKVNEYLKNVLVLTKYCFLDINIVLAFLSGFVARGDTIILQSYMPLWCNKYFVQTGKCLKQGHDSLAVKQHCRIAYKLAMKLTGISYVFVLVGAIFVGYTIHRISTNKVLGLSSVVASVGYFMFAENKNPEKNINILYVILIGLGEIGTIVTSLSFLSANKDSNHILNKKENVGKISAIYSAFGCFGIIFTSRLGGYLFDYWKPTAPFLVMGFMHVFIMIASIISFLVKKAI